MGVRHFLEYLLLLCHPLSPGPISPGPISPISAIPREMPGDLFWYLLSAAQLSSFTKDVEGYKIAWKLVS